MNADAAGREPSSGPRAPSPEFLAKVPHEFARRHLVLSDGRDQAGHERLLVAQSTRPAVVFNVGVRLGREVTTTLSEPEALAGLIDQTYRDAALAAANAAGPAAHSPIDGVPSDLALVKVEGSDDVQRDLRNALDALDQDLLNTSGKAPVVRLVDLVLFEALQRGASDVHIQPVRGKTLVRYRLDGSLHTVRELPGSLASAVVSRIKVMARLDVAEQRAPQDGRASVSMGAGRSGEPPRRIDLRISSLPNTFGERVVIRLLDPAKSPHLLSLAALGMPKDVERRYLREIERTSGIVLSTGPTGSGKTTTLYTTLSYISASNAGASSRGCELNIMTVEDPVEYDLSGATSRGATGSNSDAQHSIRLSVSQTQVDPRKNLTFATGLRHILRQDPDVIMVGEIRDEETARIAVQASLTGHLVLSTLHTNDAPSAIARLIDLAVEPFLVASSLSAVLAQRLVRKVHRPCGGEGCPECLSTGYKGRTGVFELLVLDHRLKDMVASRATATEIKAAAERAGMVTLKRAGQALVDAGMTTAQEVGRVIESLEEELA